ncbi:MAG: hypothetical protein AAB467_02545 [Patescibacteria group bacterium]
MKTRLTLLAAKLLPITLLFLGCGPLPGHNDSGTPDVPGLEAPTNLKVEALDTQVVRISWDEVSTLEVRTKIEVSFVSGTDGFAEVVVKERLTSDSNSPQTLVIEGLAPEKTAWFRASNVLMRGRGTSDYTNAVQVKMPAVTLVPPTNLIFSGLRDCNTYECTIKLSWTNNSYGDTCWALGGCTHYVGDTDESCNWMWNNFQPYQKLLDKTTSVDLSYSHRATIRFSVEVAACDLSDPDYSRRARPPLDKRSAPSEQARYTMP